MKRELFVFAGQSNAMGAPAYPPRETVKISDSYEYLHKRRRFGEPNGDFILATLSRCGEFSYASLDEAYPSGSPEEKSELCEYMKTTYFCPAMSNLAPEGTHTLPFATYSENYHNPGATLAPFVAEGWEKVGGRCAYAHIAKGGVSIMHYFDDSMLAEYNEIRGELPKIDTLPCPGASEYFSEKVKDFFSEAEMRFSEDDTSDRCFVWLQGESDGKRPDGQYLLLLKILWKKCQELGFTHFFMVRVGYFGTESIARTIFEQEEFCKTEPRAYMMTRACSLMPFSKQTEAQLSEWFKKPPEEKYLLCRDSYLGMPNEHINERGFMVAAEKFVENLTRVLRNGEEPVSEEENLIPLLDGRFS